MDWIHLQSVIRLLCPIQLSWVIPLFLFCIKFTTTQRCSSQTKLVTSEMEPCVEGNEWNGIALEIGNLERTIPDVDPYPSVPFGITEDINGKKWFQIQSNPLTLHITHHHSHSLSIVCFPFSFFLSFLSIVPMRWCGVVLLVLWFDLMHYALMYPEPLLLTPFLLWSFLINLLRVEKPFVWISGKKERRRRGKWQRKN